MEDKSNERILKAVVELAKVMKKEERGFIFAPMVQVKGNHKTMCAIDFNCAGGEISGEDVFRFWATLGGLIENAQSNLPEELLPTFKEGFIPFAQMVSERCFPTIKMTKI